MSQEVDDLSVLVKQVLKVNDINVVSEVLLPPSDDGAIGDSVTFICKQGKKYMILSFSDMTEESEDAMRSVGK